MQRLRLKIARALRRQHVDGSDILVKYDNRAKLQDYWLEQADAVLRVLERDAVRS
jgi:hypothetical protein